MSCKSECYIVMFTFFIKMQSCCKNPRQCDFNISGTKVPANTLKSDWIINPSGQHLVTSPEINSGSAWMCCSGVDEYQCLPRGILGIKVPENLSWPFFCKVIHPVLSISVLHPGSIQPAPLAPWIFLIDCMGGVRLWGWLPLKNIRTECVFHINQQAHAESCTIFCIFS